MIYFYELWKIRESLHKALDILCADEPNLCKVTKELCESKAELDEIIADCLADEEDQENQETDENEIMLNLENENE